MFRSLNGLANISLQIDTSDLFKLSGRVGGQIGYGGLNSGDNLEFRSNPFLDGEIILNDDTRITGSLILESTFQLNDLSNTYKYTFTPSNLSTDVNIILPSLIGNDTFVFEGHVQTLQNKDLTVDNTQFVDLSDPTKKIRFDLNNITPATVRTFTYPDQDGEIVLKDSTQILTNKTITDSSNIVGCDELKTTGSSVNISLSAPPTVNQVLKTTSSTTATWQDETALTNAVNIGTAGVGVFKDKVLNDLRFKKINTEDVNNIVITDDVANDEVDINIGVNVLTTSNVKTVTNKTFQDTNNTFFRAGLPTALAQFSLTNLSPGTTQVMSIPFFSGTQSIIFDSAPQSLKSKNINSANSIFYKSDANPNDILAFSLANITGNSAILLTFPPMATSQNFEVIGSDKTQTLSNKTYLLKTGVLSLQDDASATTGIRTDVNGVYIHNNSNIFIASDVGGIASLRTHFFVDGTVFIPSIRNENEPNTGFYFTTANLNTTIQGSLITSTTANGINLASGKRYSINGTDIKDVVETLTNKTLTNPTISAINNSGLLTLPTGPETLVGRDTIDTLTNKTLTSPTINNSGLITLPTGPETLLGRDTIDTLTNKTLINVNNNIAARSLHSASTVVDVSSSLAPTVGQILTATSPTTATWQNKSNDGWTDDGAVVRLTTISDSVGLGTVSPLSKLDVYSEIRASNSVNVFNRIGAKRIQLNSNVNSDQLDFEFNDTSVSPITWRWRKEFDELILQRNGANISLYDVNNCNFYKPIINSVGATLNACTINPQNIGIFNTSAAVEQYLQFQDTSNTWKISKPISTNQMRFSRNGTEILSLLQTSVNPKVPILQTGTGTFANPDYSFLGDEDTGMFRGGANQLVFATGGLSRLFVQDAFITAIIQFNIANGTVGAPGIAFSSQTNTGIYLPSASNLGVSVNGALKFNYSGTVNSSTQQLQSITGTAVSPSYAFSSDPNSGMYSPASTELALSTNGLQRVHVKTDGQIQVGINAAAAPSLAEAMLLKNVSGQNRFNWFGLGYNGSTVQGFVSGVNSVTTPTILFGGHNIALTAWADIRTDSRTAFGGGLSGAHQINVTGSAGLSTGTAWTNTSDSRIKKDIIDFDTSEQLDIINTLSVKRYKFRKQYASNTKNDKDRVQVGFIAQDVEKVWKESVTTGDTVVKYKCKCSCTCPSNSSLECKCSCECQPLEVENQKELNISDLNFMLYGAVQELSKRLNKAIERIEFLESKMNN